MTEQEQSILDARNSSAIVQYVGKDQEVSISFLEPESNSNSNGGAIQSNPMASLASLIQSSKQPQQPGSAIPPSSGGPMSPGAIANFLSVAAAVQQAKASGSSLQALPTTVPSDGEDSLMQPPSVGNCKPEEELVESRSPSNFGTRYSSPSPSSSSSFNQLPMTSTMTVTNANMLQGNTKGTHLDFSKLFLSTYIDIFNHDLFLIIFYFVQVLLLEPVLIMSMAVLLESNAPSVTSSSAPPEWLEATPGMFHVTLARLSNVLNVIGTTNTKRH